MPIQFTCSCGNTLQVDEEYGGRQAPCPVCGTPNSIPLHEPAGMLADETMPSLATGARTDPPPLPAARATPPPVPPPVPLTEIVRIDESKPVPTHSGAPISEEDDFFVEAPKGIGVLISAGATLKKDCEPFTAAARAGIVLASTGMGVFLGILIAVLWTGINIGLALWMSGLGLIGLLVSLHYTRFAHTCSYAGKNGLARYRCRGRRDNIVLEELFLFKDAGELRIAQTRNYYNGAYTGTNYSYTWTDARKQKVYALSGRHNSEAGTPKPADAFWFAHAGETAWSIYLMNRMEELADEKGRLYFSLKKNTGVEVGPGTLNLHLGGEPIHLKREDIAQVQISQGVFAVREPGAKEGWFSSHGVHKFPYHDLGNAQFFLFVLERLVGVRATP